jgi:hypothetical protein
MRAVRGYDDNLVLDDRLVLWRLRSAYCSLDGYGMHKPPNAAKIVSQQLSRE